MISLLLTLFISLFSCCPSINRLEDHTENNITINDTLPTKNVADYNDSTYFITMTDLMSVGFLRNMINFSVNNYGVDFKKGTGTSYSVQLQNFNIELLNLTDLDYTDFDNTQNLTTLSSIVIDSNKYTHYQVFYLNFYFAISDYNFYLQFFSFDTEDYSTPQSPSLEGTLENCVCRVIPGGSYFNYTTRSLKVSSTDLDGELLNLFINVSDKGENYQFEDGYRDGYGYGYDIGWYDGKGTGYQQGYQQALEDTAETSSTASTIFQGIFDVGLLPVNVFLTIFNFEVFGVNISGIISGLLTLAVVVIVLRFLLGGSKDDK